MCPLTPVNPCSWIFILGKLGKGEITYLDMSGRRPRERRIGGSGLCWSVQGRATTHCGSVRYIAHCLGISGRTCVPYLSRFINNIARNSSMTLRRRKRALYAFVVGMHLVERLSNALPFCTHAMLFIQESPSFINANKTVVELISLSVFLQLVEPFFFGSSCGNKGYMRLRKCQIQREDD